MKAFRCPQCGSSSVRYVPGDNKRQCESCGYAEPVVAVEADHTEHDFLAALERDVEAEAAATVKAVRCETCGAVTTVTEQTTATFCPFCGASAVVPEERRAIKPQAILPFAIDAKAAQAAYQTWLRKLWFAPNALRRVARLQGRLAGLYVPYWTYDARADTAYSGLRGDDYTVTESYTAMENGRPVHKTRTVVKTRWTPASGRVRNDFDDVLVVASRSLPRAYVDRLEPWDLNRLVAYDEAYLGGFRAECYQVGLKDGFGIAKERMQPAIDATIRADVGGDHQQIASRRSQYSSVTFKHLLLPLWLAAYRYKGRSYRFLVNARTGEVTGERPWSVVKISFAVLLLALLVTLAAYLHRNGWRLPDLPPM